MDNQSINQIKNENKAQNKVENKDVDIKSTAAKLRKERGQLTHLELSGKVVQRGYLLERGYLPLIYQLSSCVTSAQGPHGMQLQTHLLYPD